MARTLSKGRGRDMSRLRRFAQNHLGVKMMDDMQGSLEVRNPDLDVFDAYYENSQYDDLIDWESAAKYEEYVPVRERKPRIIYNVAKIVSDKVAGKLVGMATFPTFKIEEDEDDTAFLRAVQKACKYRSSLVDPIKRCLNSGAVFVRYYMADGACKIEYALSKYCYPKWDQAGNLLEVAIRYVYSDPNDVDRNGTPKKKWYQLVLSQTADVDYDNPEYQPGVKPTFTETGRNDHGLGWVQGEWFSTTNDKFNYDGTSLIKDVLTFIDDLNYSLSQSSQATQYGQEPQLVTNGIDENELDALIKSSQKAWNLGKEGEAQYLETDLAGVTAAGEQRDKFSMLMWNVVRVVLQDPEKIDGTAQSGEALRQLNAPMIELIDELRAVFEPTMIKLLLKIAFTFMALNGEGFETALEIPKGYTPSSTDVMCQWPNIFPPTLADLNAMATALNSLTMAQIISRETATRFVATNTTIIDNVEEELSKIETQEPLPSAFGTFGGP